MPDHDGAPGSGLGGDDLSPGTPDADALRRRVLLTAVVAFVLFLTAAYVITALRASGLWLLPAMALLVALVVRPLMKPVRDATRLRRALAYEAFRQGRA